MIYYIYIYIYIYIYNYYFLPNHSHATLELMACHIGHTCFVLCTPASDNFDTFFVSSLVNNFFL